MSDGYEDDYEKTYGRLLAKAWSDDAFKEQLLHDPTTTLRSNGIDVPDGLEVVVVELPPPQDLPMATPGRFILVLPPRPTAAEISDEELARVAGGDAQLRLPRWWPRCYCHGA